MKPFIFNQWHAWNGTVGILLSDESKKKLRQFKDVDACVNWLYLSGHKDAARAIDTHAKTEKLEFTKIRHDCNGNPRYVCHFLNLNTRAELDNNPGTSEKYAIAIKRANSIGGRRFHNKQYGGGILFQSYSLDETAARISQATGRKFKAIY